MSRFIDYYAILGISRHSSAADVKKAYRTKVRIHHPDAGGDEAMFRKTKEAYDVLKNEQVRKRYDEAYERYYTPTRTRPVSTYEEPDEYKPKKYIPIGSYLLILVIVLLCMFSFSSFFSELFLNDKKESVAVSTKTERIDSSKTVGISIGMSKNEVKDIMGKPDSAESKKWKYGQSFVFFNYSEKVDGWSNVDGSLKIK